MMIAGFKLILSPTLYPSSRQEVYQETVLRGIGRAFMRHFVLSKPRYTLRYDTPHRKSNVKLVNLSIAGRQIRKSNPSVYHQCLKMAPWKRRSLLETIIFSFYFKLWGCNKEKQPIITQTHTTGWWLNHPSEKYARQICSLPQGSGWK